MLNPIILMFFFLICFDALSECYALKIRKTLLTGVIDRQGYYMYNYMYDNIYKLSHYLFTENKWKVIVGSHELM